MARKKENIVFNIQMPYALWQWFTEHTARKGKKKVKVIRDYIQSLYEKDKEKRLRRRTTKI